MVPQYLSNFLTAMIITEASCWMDKVNTKPSITPNLTSSSVNTLSLLVWLLGLVCSLQIGQHFPRHQAMIPICTTLGFPHFTKQQRCPDTAHNAQTGSLYQHNLNKMAEQLFIPVYNTFHFHLIFRM